MKRTLLIVILVLFFIISGLLAYYGMFSPLNVEEKTMGPFSLVYQRHTGEYSGIGPKIEEVRTFLEKELNIYCVRGFGIYLDNPSVTPVEKRRALCGCILDVDDKDIRARVAKRYSIRDIDEGSFVTAEFPSRGKLSYMLGPMKVYPAFEKYFKGKNIPGGPSMEIYESDRIVFLMALTPGQLRE